MRIVDGEEYRPRDMPQQSEKFPPRAPPPWTIFEATVPITPEARAKLERQARKNLEV